MRISGLLFSILVALLLTSLGLAEAAGKQAKPPALPKAIYEAPMRVFIVRSSEPSCEPNCPQWIGAEGEITGATPQAFRKIFKQLGKQKLPIIIRSPGGSILAALEIGRMVRERGLTVAVGYTQFKGCSPADKNCKLPKEDRGIYAGVINENRAFCNSACPLILAGGTTRIASYMASIGVHQPKTTWTRRFVRYREFYKIVGGKKKVINRKIVSSKNVPGKTTFGLDKRLRGQLAAYHKTMGVSPAILDEFKRADHDELYFLTQTQTDAFQLRTSPLRAAYLSMSIQCGTKGTNAVCVLDKSRAKKLALLPKVVTPQVKAIVKPVIAVVRPGAFLGNVMLVRRSGDDCSAGCPHWIAIEGIITNATAQQLEKLLLLAKGARLPVVLNAKGTNLNAAIKIGRIIHGNKLDVFVAKTVPDICSDATKGCTGETIAGALVAHMEYGGQCDDMCALIFAAGANRVLSHGARVSFQNLSSWQQSERQRYKMAVYEYMSSLKYSSTVTYRMFGTGKTKIADLNYGELSEMGFGDKFADKIPFIGKNPCSPVQLSFCIILKN